MRWLVEVSSLGKTDTQKFCVEAESWQRALQAARSQRGEDGPMSGFSIELLEEGYRAVDPLARVRFVVKKAPDDMPITAVVSKDPKGGVAPAAPNTGSIPPKAASIAPPAPAAAASAAPPPAAPSAAASAPPNSGSGDATTPNLPPSPTSSARDGASKKAPPRPGQSQPPSAQAGAALLDAIGATGEKKKSQTMVFASAGDASVVDKAPAAVDRAAPPAIGSAIPGLPPVKLLTSREQNPNDASPLTYREYAFAVPAGTSEEVAADVLRAQLRYVEAHIATAKTGKLVNLAVFDVEFTGKPPKSPVATLTWKDWKGEPVVGFPRRGGNSRPPRPPSQIPPSMLAATDAQAAAVSVPPAPAVPQIAQPVAQDPPKQTTQPIPPDQAAQARQAVQAQEAAKQEAAAQAAQAQAAAQAAQQQAAAQAAQQAQALAEQQAAQQAQALAAQQAAAQAAQQAQALAEQQAAAQAAAQQAAAAQAQAAEQAAQQAQAAAQPAAAQQAAAQAQPAFPVPPPEPTFAEAKHPSQPPGAAASGMVKTPSGRFVRGRVSGDELITSLFESMHDLHFLRDALDGGQFCLALATEVLPARAAIIHFFDIEKREWVVACTRGKDTQRLLTMRAAEGDELLRECARKRRALVVANASTATSERYRQLNGARSLIAAPIMQAGRALGALEIINPLDGMPFTEDEGNAMTYIAEQYAEYLGSRGIVLDRDRIQNAAAR